MRVRQPLRNLAAEHAPDRIRARLRHRGHGDHVGDAVLGAIDGSITSFAIVAGAIGAGLSGFVVLVLGFASLLADGFSMAVSNYLGTRAERESAEQAEREELRHIDAVPDGEREELRQVLAARGFDGDILQRIVDTIARDRALWAQTIVSEAFGFHRVDAGRPRRAAIATFLAFIGAGLVPLLPFLWPALPIQQAFVASSIATSIAFVGIGTLKGQALGLPRLRAGIETLLLGGTAALLAYGVGALLRSWLGDGWAG